MVPEKPTLLLKMELPVLLYDSMFPCWGIHRPFGFRFRRWRLIRWHFNLEDGLSVNDDLVQEYSAPSEAEYSSGPGMKPDPIG